MPNNIPTDGSKGFEELRQQYVMSQLEIERLNKEIQDISA